jgi:capsular exopolysaccharide synthesis family protein
MSRIDEALRRSRTPTSGTSATPQKAWATDQDAAPQEDEGAAAESPWSFDRMSEAPPAPSGRSVADTGAGTDLGDTPLFGPRPVPDSPARRASTPARREPQGPQAPVPDVHGDDGTPVFGGFERGSEERVVVSKAMPPVSVEQYRRLAATLHHAQADRGIKRVMVTSAVTGEGKSLTATNLALTLSQSYRRRVLLIDADLRRPSLHRIFQVQNVFGLTEGLKARDERQLAIVEISEYLSLLTAGRPDPDPMSGLTSDRMRRILNEASTKFDWIVIDTPPVALLPDANLLAAMVDVAVLVVGATRTPYDLVQRAAESIGRDKIMGVVLNRVENTGFVGDAHYHSYYGDYQNS